MIQARIIEVTLSDEYQMGIDWSAIAKGDSLRGTFTQILSPATNIFQVGISDSDFSLLMAAMSRQGKIDILSSPKVSTLNNQPAVIKVATEEVYWEREFAYTAGVGGQTQGFSRPRWITVGILLKVTPQIGPNGWITLDIHPSVTEKVGESVSPEGDVAPILAVRETNTVARIRDGQTIVIAGLLQKRETTVVTSVPFLGKIPLLGALFRKTVKEKRKTELVIMFTPTIVVGNEIQDQFAEGFSSDWKEVR
jgi:type II secretory pathway component GspD/PulD (secretin)